MKNTKVAIQSEGTSEHGQKIINYLESLGAKNSLSYMGTAKNIYYYINDTGSIAVDGSVPDGYTLITNFDGKRYPNPNVKLSLGGEMYLLRALAEELKKAGYFFKFDSCENDEKYLLINCFNSIGPCGWNQLHSSRECEKRTISSLADVLKIVEEVTQLAPPKKVITICGHEVEKDSKRVKIGCKEVTLSDANKFYKVCSELGVTEVSTTYGKVSFSQMQEIINM